MITVKQYNSINGTATTEEQEIEIDVRTIHLIQNDDDTNDLLIGLHNSTETDDNYIVIKAGEYLKNLKITTKKFYVKSSASTVAFRFIGTKEA